MKRLFFLLAAAVLLTSCSTYADGTSVWAGGAFLLFWLPVIGAAVFGYFGYKSWKSGTVTGGNAANPTRYSDERLPWYKVWQWVFAAVLFMFAIVALIVQNSSR